MNLSQLRERARSLSGIRLDTLRSDEEIDQLLNEAYFEVAGLSQWPFLAGREQVHIVSGEDEIDTPNGYTELTSVSYTDDQGNSTRLRPYTLDEIDLLNQDEAGDPVFYARINEKRFRIWPSPNKNITLTLRGKKQVETLRSDNDKPVFDEQFHPMISYRTASRLLAEEGDESGRAEFYQVEANTFFSRMQQFYTRSGDSGIFTLGGRRARLSDGG